MRFFAKSFLFIVALWSSGPTDAYAQDAAAGQKTFNACRACHQIGDNAANSIGPVLTGVVGRKAGSIPDFRYSDANKNSGITWDEPTLMEYLRNPQAKVPGTKMMFPGLKKDEDIANVIAFLKTQTSH